MGGKRSTEREKIAALDSPVRGIIRLCELGNEVRCDTGVVFIKFREYSECVESALVSLEKNPLDESLLASSHTKKRSDVQEPLTNAAVEMTFSSLYNICFKEK
jgi:hypothetical protein